MPKQIQPVPATFRRRVAELHDRKESSASCSSYSGRLRSSRSFVATARGSSRSFVGELFVFFRQPNLSDIAIHHRFGWIVKPQLKVRMAANEALLHAKT
ncbi:hypothetical protein QYF36_019477 [Acer negundo]|nr:hypothetical protein QYF36_019477 [Acer negundo]